MKVGIIGAGLAGLAAGLDLADRGHEVELLERRPWAGGATYSFLDNETGEEIDNGQHLFMECTTAYRSFLERLGTLNLAFRQDRLRVSVFDQNGNRSDLWASNLPFGMHLAPTLFRYHHLSWRQKLEILRAFLSLRQMQVYQRGRLENITFAKWLREQGQSPATIREFWDFLILPTLNCRADQASASQAIFVLEEGFQKDPQSAALAVPTVGLSKLHVDPATRAIQKLGGKISLRAAIERLEIEDRRVTGVVLASNERRTFDAYVSTLAPWRLLPLLPEKLQEEEPFSQLKAFEPASILNLHLWFDRPVADFNFGAFIHSEVQWVFNRTRLAGKNENQRQHLVISISAPDDLFTLNQEQICNRVLPQLQQALPTAQEATLLRYRVIKEPEATFLPTPGLRRPNPRTPIQNLFLAGAYTATGWPATMESAVRSGIAAAAAAAAAAVETNRT
tara:strand:- start:21015 stop:22364 length:1350 start_codon:yes stop_codon:yes gene_type:complete